MWHCPHCGAPQAETARCWVCRRSSTTCSTCRHFRASLAADVGYCALDRRRLPLTGRELRGCWQAAVAGAATAAPPPAVEAHRLRGGGATRPLGAPDHWIEAVPPRDFVPLELVGRPATADGAAATAPERPEPGGTTPAHAAFVIAEPDDDWAERTSLFGERDR
jgi:hypothetical protein